MSSSPVRVVLARVVRPYDNHAKNERMFIAIGETEEGIRNARLIVDGYLEQLTQPEPAVPATLRVFNPGKPVVAKTKTPVRR